MNFSMSARLGKILPKYRDDEIVGPILVDVAQAKQGVFSTNKPVKQYMLQEIHANYDKNEEIQDVVTILKNSTTYATMSKQDIFKYQDECYFWYDFLNCYALWKIIEMKYGFPDGDQSYKYNLLIRIVLGDLEVFKEYPDL